jgi:ribosomal protein S18 acetylase RimI-like enzyme
MQQLNTLADVAAASGADPQCLWAAQGLQAGGLAWEHAGAVAVACPGLSGRDRLVLRGPAGAAALLVREAMSALGPSYVPIGDPELMASVLERARWLAPGECFGWMDGIQPPRYQPVHAVRWLARREWQAADAVLTVAFPDTGSRAWLPGIRRWAGIADPGGRLTCAAADAWSSPGVGFLAGVAVVPDARRAGQGRDVCGFLLTALLAAHGRVALMVRDKDAAAIGLYAQLGMTHRLQQMLRVAPAGRAAPPQVSRP